MVISTVEVMGDTPLPPTPSVSPNKGSKPMIVIKSYIGYVEASTGLLLGGVTKHRSARFTKFADAVKWCEVIVKGNLQAKRYPVYGGIYPSNQGGEI